MFFSALLALVLPLNPAFAVPSRPAENNLSRSFAQFRRDQVNAVEYTLHFTFTKGSEEYQAETTARLNLASVKAPLSFDWLGRAPESVRVNGKAIQDFKSATGSLEIPAKYLKPETEVAFTFTNGFDKEGEGIQRIVDPEDKEEYIYTDFEPYQAHKLFPCLDQPDIKAHFALTVTAPSDWKAIGNELVAEEKDEGGRKTTRFQATPLLSTYLFFVGAGPYTEWKEQEGKTPLFLYARKSLAKYVDADNLFASSKKGLRFYSNYFGITYPFSKFGLVFAPEFGWGGMENPGAIVVNESTIFRGPVPLTRRESRDSLILHEMAHMWFGDLVTMQWWNDLWLNESFATYLAAIAQDRALDSKNTWQSFASEKTWGYWQDQLVTTHPIETKVPTVREAKGNFDGITYSKGAAALEQLHFFVGEDAFQEGVATYFKKHAFANAERADFVGEIARAAKKNLGPWTHAWLQTAGPNRVRASFACAGDALRSLTLTQEPSRSGTLSPHRTRIGLFKAEKDQLTLLAGVSAPYEGRTTKVSVPAGTACPDFVYPNLDDKDYALFSLDEASLRRVEQVLTGGVKDPLLRLMVWNTLYQMVRDGKLPPLRYLALAQAGLAKETDESVLSPLLSRYSNVRTVFSQYISVADRAALAPGFEKMLRERAVSEKGGLQMLFFDFYANVAQTDEALKDLRTMFEKNTPPAGLEFDQDRRWLILRNLAKNGVAEALPLVQAEEARDPTQTGHREAAVARNAFPKLETKREFWQKISTPDALSPDTLRESAGLFSLPNHPELAEPFAAEFFARVKQIDWKKSDFLVGVYFEELFPASLCSKKLLAESERELKSAKNLTTLARRSWLEANDELGRCVKVAHR